jgi:hypothetical protein
MGIGLGIGINRSNYAQGIFNAYQSRVIADGGVTEAGGCVDAVSGLLLTASLLLIPSGYKSGKAYAQIPTNGNGDLTWTRASTANRTNSSGNIELMGSGVPRLSYMYGSCPALLLEPQRTNVVLHSGDLSQSSWTKTNYALSNVSAIQGLTATRITKNSTNNGLWLGTGARAVINFVGTFASGTKAFSCLIRKGNTAKVGLLINQILVGASISASCEFDFATETFTNVSSGLTATFEKPTTDVYRLILVVNDIGIGTSKALWIAPVDSSNNTVTDGYVDVAYFQWEAGAYPTTYIPTTTASATRVADSFSRNNIYTNGLITSSGGTWFVELRNNIVYTRDFAGHGLAISDQSNPAIGGGNAGNTFAIIRTSTSLVRLQIVKQESLTFTSLFTTTTDTTKIAIKWNGSTADVFANGTKVVSATAFTATSLQNLVCTAMDVPKFIQQMALYPSPLSDTDCTIITTL